MDPISRFEKMREDQRRLDGTFVTCAIPVSVHDHVDEIFEGAN